MMIMASAYGLMRRRQQRDGDRAAEPDRTAVKCEAAEKSIQGPSLTQQASPGATRSQADRTPAGPHGLRQVLARRHRPVRYSSGMARLLPLRSLARCRYRRHLRAMDPPSSPPNPPQPDRTPGLCNLLIDTPPDLVAQKDRIRRQAIRQTHTPKNDYCHLTCRHT